MLGDDGVARPAVFHDRFTTCEPDEAAEVICDSYGVVSRLALRGGRDGFAFSHDVLGAGAFALNRLRHSMSIGYDTHPLDAAYTVGDVHVGRLSFDVTGFGHVEVGAGGLALGATQGDASYTTAEVDLSPVTLDRASVAVHAAGACGLGPDELAFTDPRPLSPALARFWRTTVDHVRERVLGDPAMAASPIVIDGAFRTLASALLSTFPNNALAAATEPGGGSARADVSERTLREVIDYLRGHAHRPIGPADVAEVAGAPAVRVGQGLRRRHDTDPAHLLWHARLDGVRRDLRAGDPDEGTSVLEIAARWGFTDLPRFRVAYREAFREPPERTLHA